MTRFIAGAVIVVSLLGAACGDRPTPPTRPSGTTDEPQPTPQPPPQPPLVLPPPVTGVVTELTSKGARPLEGVDIDAVVSRGTFVAFYSGGPTDADGRYEIVGASNADSIWLYGSKEGYVQPCAAEFKGQGEPRVDIQLVSKERIAVSAPSSPPGTRSVSGKVFETVAGVRQPVAGASVGFQPPVYLDFPGANTFSDAAGRYRLCGLPEQRPVELGASDTSGRWASLSVPVGQTTGVDIELK